VKFDIDWVHIKYGINKSSFPPTHLFPVKPSILVGQRVK